MRLTYAIVYVRDMSKAVPFYRDVVGLPLRFESPYWTEFATEGATLALHHGEEADREDPQRLFAGRCRPGIEVPDLDAFHERMCELEVPCVQEPREVFGSRLASYLDPDGLVFGVSQAKD